MSIFVGMDLGSKSVNYEVRGVWGEKPKRGRLVWDVEAWERLLTGYPREEVMVAFETGPEGYRAKKIVDGLGIDSYPFHAASFLSVWRTKRKTDRIDASKICRALQGGTLPEKVHLPNDAEAMLRNLVTERDHHLKILCGLSNRAKGLGRQWGVLLPGYTREKGEEWWAETLDTLPKACYTGMHRCGSVALATLQAVEELQEEVVDQVGVAGLTQHMERLKTVPGIGKIVAPAVIAYLGDGKRFRSARKFSSYVGFTPSVDQTGERAVRLGHITKEGPSILRRMFIQASYGALRNKEFGGTEWDKWYRRLAKRRGKKIAVVALARKIAGICYAIVRDEEVWDSSHLRSTTP